MGMKKHLLIILITLILICALMSGCTDQKDSDDDEDDDEDTTSVPDYTELNIEDLANEKRLDVPTRRNVAGYCYLESYSMMLAHLDSSIDTPEIIASAGLGAPIFCDSYSKNLRVMEHYTVDVHTTSMNNFGISWVVGYTQDGHHGSYLDGASAKLVYPSENALIYLKAVLNSNRTIQVHIDLHYLESYNLKFQDMPEGSSHFMVVTGYDENNIYLSDTYLGDTANDQFTDMPVPVNTFLSAWEHGGDINEGFDLQTGPYWMLFFTSTASSDLEKSSYASIISLQEALSADVDKEIDTYISLIDSGEYDLSDTSWNQIANIKQLFSEYLTDNGNIDAANAYLELYALYLSCETNIDSPDDVEVILSTIQTREASARNLLL